MQRKRRRRRRRRREKKEEEEKEEGMETRGGLNISLINKATGDR